MPPHSTGSGTISFGLVSIPVKTFTAASSNAVAFNILHSTCGGRIRQQIVCPACNEVLDRTAQVKGFEFAKDQYVRFTDDELKALEEENSKMIDIIEFVPLDQVDPIFFEKTYYLGPDKGGEKAYRLLADAMEKTNRVALGRFVMRGKGALVLIRAAQQGLMLHTMYWADEVRDFSEIGKGDGASARPGELELAIRLIEELSGAEFHPEKYDDVHRRRVLEVVEMKVAGQEITVSAPAERAQVIDLLDALKQSLEMRSSGEGGSGHERKPAARTAAKTTAAAEGAAGADTKKKTASRR